MNYPHPLIAREGWPFPALRLLAAAVVVLACRETAVLSIFMAVQVELMVTVALLQSMADHPQVATRTAVLLRSRQAIKTVQATTDC